MKTEQWIKKLLTGNQPEYGTLEYWEKERRSKFRVNARRREERYRKSTNAIIDLWNTVMEKQPLYYLESLMNSKVQYSNKDGTYQWSIPINE